MSLRYLTALPVYNEVAHVNGVLNEVLKYSPDVLVVNDGSTDGTAELLAGRTDIQVVNHPQNRGYGAALVSAFHYAQQQGYDVLVTIDCDGQHEPKLIPTLVAATTQADIVSGSRYLRAFGENSLPPIERRRINVMITDELNQRLGLNLTDAFCGFKAYRVPSLAKLNITEPGYAMPLELWVQAVAAGLNVIEEPVPLVYLDEKRSFGGALDDGNRRLAYYHSVIDRSLAAVCPPAVHLPSLACCELGIG